MNGTVQRGVETRAHAGPLLGFPPLEYIDTPVGALPSAPGDADSSKGGAWRAAATICNQDCFTTCTVQPEFCCF